MDTEEIIESIESMALILFFIVAVLLGLILITVFVQVLLQLWFGK